MSYGNDKRPQERHSTLSGVVLTIAVHAALVILVSFSSLKYIYPPP